MDVRRLLSVLFGWLPLPAQKRLKQSKLSGHSQITLISSKECVEEVYTVRKILSKDCTLLPGHLMISLVRTGLLVDVVSMFDKVDNVYYLATQTAANVCGHPTIVHGGMQGTLCDEGFAGLIYGMKRQDALPAGPAVTAQLTVNFRKPMPAQGSVLCTAKVQKIEGRKVFVEASIDDLNSEEHFVDATALFIMLQPQKKASPPA